VTQVDVGPAARLYGMMQHLLTVAAHHELPEAAPERGVVLRDDALDAILQVAAVIDEAVQTDQISVDRGVHGISMLMLAREYIQPLPRVPGKGGMGDKVTPDLAELVALLRQVGGTAGIQG
jgi:hypothetical protein